MPPPQRLLALDGMRAFMEYFIIRHHIVPSATADARTGHHDPIGSDVMSFFFVLTGFVTMYRAEHEDLSTWARKKRFWMSRLTRIYPIFLMNWLFQWFGRGLRLLVDRSYEADPCVYWHVCPYTQLIMMDNWLGCGYGLLNGVTWYISAIFWLWILFPFAKDRISSFFSSGRPWERICYVGLGWMLVPVLMLGFDLYTVMPFPPARLGEFLVGCGVAVVIHRNEPYPSVLANRKYWVPGIVWACFFNLALSKHWFSFLCLRESTHSEVCAVWKFGQDYRENEPPCILVLDKLVNKTALIWAALVYGLARADMDGDTDWVLRLLRSEAMQTLASISVVVYISHVNVAHALTHVCRFILGWPVDDWRGDAIMLAVYCMCYALQKVLLAHAPALMGRWALSIEARKTVPEEAVDGERDMLITECDGTTGMCIVDEEEEHETELAAVDAEPRILAVNAELRV